MPVLMRRILLALMLMACAVTAQAQSLDLSEEKVKAALLYNFFKYTSWPAAAPSGPMVLCVYGDDPFGGSLQLLQGRSVNQREIAVRILHDTPDIASCHLLFVNADEKDEWPKLRQSLAAKPILTVSDYPGFAAGGGMIEFGRKENHISVSLNLEATHAGQLAIGERLLNLVTVVHPAAKGQ